MQCFHFLGRRRSRIGDADCPTHISVNQHSGVPTTPLTESRRPPVEYHRYAVCDTGINPQLAVSDQTPEYLDLACIESDGHLAGHDPPLAMSDSPSPEIDSAMAESESPPDYVTYMREHSQTISGHANLSYITDNPVFDPRYEPPPPSYSDVVPSDSTPDKNMPAESPPEHRTVVDITMDPEYVVCLPSISQTD